MVLPMTTRATEKDFEQHMPELEQNSVNLKHGYSKPPDGEDNYRLMIEHQNDLIVRLDSDFRLLFVSPSYCELFGKNADHFIGKKFNHSIQPIS